MVLLPRVLNWLEFAVAGLKSVPPAFGQTLDSALTLLLMGILVWILMRSLRDRERARRTTEAELSQGEERFRTIFENARWGIAEGDLATAQIADLNPHFAEIIGHPRDELMSSTFKDFTHPEDLARDLTEFRKLAGGEIHTFALEKRYIRKDGTIIWVNLTVSRLEASGNKPPSCLATIEDISARKQAELALNESEVRYRRLVESTTEAVLVIGQHEHLLEINSIGRTIFGYRDAEICRLKLQDLFAPIETARLRSEIARFGSADVAHSEWQFRRKDGGIFWGGLNVTLMPDGSRLCFVRDITRRKNAEAQLRESETRFRTLFENASVGIVICRLLRDENGRITDYVHLHANNAVRVHTGLAVDAVTGKRCSEVVSPDETTRFVERLVQVLETGKPYSYQQTFPTLQRTTENRPFFLEGDTFAVTFFDITERLQTEEKFLRLGRLYAVSSGINEAIVRSADQRSLFKHACQIAVDKGGFLMAWVGLADPQTDKIEPVAHWGRGEGCLATIEQVIPPDSAMGQGLVGVAFRTGKPAYCNDIAGDADTFAGREEALHRGYRSCGVFPLKLKGLSVGILSVYSSRPDVFGPDEVHLLNALAENLAFAIEAGQRETQRREAEAALARSEENQRRLAVMQTTILDSLPAHIALLSSAGEIVAVNEAWRRFGKENHLPGDDFRVGRNYLETCERATEDCAQGPREAARGIRRVLEGEPGTFVLEFPCHVHGSQRWFRLSVNALAVNRREGAVVMYVDITERKLAHEVLRLKNDELHALSRQLEREHSRLEEAQAVANIGSWETELPGTEVWWSEESYRIFEYSPNRPPLTHQAFLALVHPDDRERVDRAFHHSLSTRTRHQIEHRALLPDGRIKVIEERWKVNHDEQGLPIRVVGTSQDVTERRRAEEELLAYQKQFEVLFRDSPIAIGWGNPRDGKIIDVNHKFEALFGWNREEAAKLRITDFNPVKGSTVWRNILLRAVKSGRVENVEIKLLRRSGQIFDALLSVERLSFHQETMLAIMVMDVTDLSRAQKELDARARQQGTLAAVGRLALARGTLSTLFEQTVGLVARTLSLEFCKISELLPDRSGVKLVAGVGWREGLIGHAVLGVNDDYQAGYTLKSMIPIVVNDLQSETRFRAPSLLQEHGIVSGINVVIGDRKEPWGVLGAHDTRQRIYTPNEVGFLQSVADMLATAIARSRAEKSMQRLSAALLQAEDRERHRIARELHDSTVQDLVAAMMNLEFLRDPAKGLTTLESQRIEDSLALLENCAHDIRTLSYRLHPPRLNETGLAGAIRHYLEGFGERTGLITRLELPHETPRLGETTELALFRMVQEALGNVHRHAQSQTATVRLSQEGNQIVLEIADQGCGIPSDMLKTGIQSKGVGISSMKERLLHIGGRLEIESGSAGTTIRAIAPIPSASP